jgi:hypothetical protein
MNKAHSITVRALVIVTCGGPQLYVRDCPYCAGTHCHSGCEWPICSRCAIGKTAIFFLSAAGLRSCDPRKTVLIDKAWGGKQFCGKHEYHLTLADDPPYYAPGHENNPCARTIAQHLETLGMGAAVACGESIRPDPRWYCERCPPCYNRKS